MALPNEDSAKMITAKMIMEHYRTESFISSMFQRERYEWSELKFYHRWYLKLRGRLPPLKPYKLPESNPDNVIRFKRPSTYVANHDSEEHF